jgi:hypothetical protein
MTNNSYEAYAICSTAHLVSPIEEQFPTALLIQHSNLTYEQLMILETNSMVYSVNLETGIKEVGQSSIHSNLKHFAHNCIAIVICPAVEVQTVVFDKSVA